ncbi:MAG: major capsid protein [Hyphomicrobiaceae bacterium]
MTAGTLNRHSSWAQDTVVSTMDPIFSFFVPTFFGTVKNFDTEFIEYDIVEGGVRIAPYASPMSLGKSTRDRGYRTYQLKPAYIKLLDTVRPGQGFTRRPGEQYGGQLTPMQRLQMQEAEKIITHREMIETRWEQMAAEALFTGMLTIFDEDYPRAVVDFERSPNLDITVGTAWTDTANADPMSDIQAIAEVMNTETRNGAIADTVTMRSSTFDLVMKNAKFRDSLDKEKNQSSNATQGFEATGLRSTDKKAQKRGRLGGQYDLWTYDGYYENDSGVQQFFTPLDSVLVTSQQSIDGRRYHGAIFDMDAGMQALDVFVKTRDLWNPSGREVLTQSAPMLGMRRPNASGVLRVRA